MDHYIIFHHLGTFWVGKLGLLACRVHFMGRSHFGDLGSKTFISSFEALNNHFWSKILQMKLLISQIYSIH
jgi:hypothetical protein